MDDTHDAFYRGLEIVDEVHDSLMKWEKKRQEEKRETNIPILKHLGLREHEAQAWLDQEPDFPRDVTKSYQNPGFDAVGGAQSARGGIRTHEGLRHGMAHPRCWLGLEFGARGQDATRPSSQTCVDLALGPPHPTNTSERSTSLKALRRGTHVIEGSLMSPKEGPL